MNRTPVIIVGVTGAFLGNTPLKQLSDTKLIDLFIFVLLKFKFFRTNRKIVITIQDPRR
jgi:hypothetical protein